MSYKYSRYISHVMNHPWAITPDKLAVLTELIRERAAGQKPSDEEIVARIGDGDRMSRPAGPSTIAVIPIHGVIAHRADAFEASSGGTSTEVIGRALRAVVDDESIASILLDLDTPGGSVEGVPELAAQIARATAVKPVVAHVNALAASAGYWLASQCTEIYCTPSGMAGSIGVYLLLVDESKALEQAGIVVNAISAGDHKLDGAPWQPLSDDARAHFKRQVDAVDRDFVASVAKGRGVSAADVRRTYGQGRVFNAREALALGMVDRIATYEETIARLAKGSVTLQRQPQAAAIAPIIEALVEGVLPVAAVSAVAQDRDALALLVARTE